MPFDLTVAFSYVVGILILCIICVILKGVDGLISKLINNAILGGAAIIFINIIGRYLFNLHISLNPFTALSVGILGVPGVVLIMIIQRFYT